MEKIKIILKGVLLYGTLLYSAFVLCINSSESAALLLVLFSSMLILWILCTVFISLDDVKTLTLYKYLWHEDNDKYLM